MTRSSAKKYKPLPGTASLHVEDEPFAIPAATVQDVDLSRLSSATAAEIRWLGHLMDCGDETPEQMAQLIGLLHDAGFLAKSEYLLRRNMNAVANGLALYHELYGTEKPDDFAAAIEAFGEQFSLDLDLVKERGFLDRGYRTVPSLVRFDEFQLLSEPCEVRFDYANKDAVEADVSSLGGDEYLILRWVNGVWETDNGSAG
jgi:hypothetical protein